MSWLEGRLPKWGPFGGGSTAVLDREETPEPELIPDNRSPRLMVLVNDAAGFACFKTHIFPDAKSATEFVLYWFRHDSDGFSAFWALAEEPSSGLGALPGAIAEPLVMIKDDQRVDVVYSFSFVDMESAQAFVHDEIENGADPAQITLHWAVPVRLTTDARGTMMLTPSVPPGAAAEGETEAKATDVWAAQEERGVEQAAAPDAASARHRVLEEAPTARTGVADDTSVGQETFELTSWVERARKKPLRSEPDETPSPRTRPEIRFDNGARAAVASFEAPVVTEEMRLVDLYQRESTSGSPVIGEPMYTATDEPVAELVREVVDTALDVALDEAAVEPAEAPARAEAEGRLELDEQREQRLEALVDETQPHVESVAPSMEIEDDGRAAQPDERSNGYENGFISHEPFDIVVHTNGHSKVETAEPSPEVTESPEATMETEVEDDNGIDQAFEIRIDIQLGSSRAMKMKRWEVKERPFDGFKSPPGRF